MFDEIRLEIATHVLGGVNLFAFGNELCTIDKAVDNMLSLDLTWGSLKDILLKYPALTDLHLRLKKQEREYVYRNIKLRSLGGYYKNNSEKLILKDAMSIEVRALDKLPVLSALLFLYPTPANSKQKQEVEADVETDKGSLFYRV